MFDKTKAILMLLVLVLVPIGLSDDSGITADDENQADEFTTNNGAIFRMLQLERSVTKAGLVSNLVIDAIEDGSGGDTTQLELTLSDLLDLLYDIKDAPGVGTPQELAKEFITLKKEAQSLTNEFKRVSNQLLTSEDRKALKDAMAGIDDQLSAVDENIKLARQTLNADRIEEMLDETGMSDPAMVEQIRSGEMTLEQVKEQLKQKFGEMPDEDKKQAVNAVKTQSTKRTQEESKVAKAVKDEVPTMLQERAAERIEKRAQKEADLDAMRAENEKRKSDILEKPADTDTKSKGDKK